ncbi:metallophosphoesterase [Pseudonocardia spinosispora]|uniref:metallophosphoesterase n=1 Tax=Pseudonocardia spinosispora TaxID=103441 RepID=UPI00042A1A19|nr:metallophosphoesterase [Pseudonocardia spinosispora]
MVLTVTTLLFGVPWLGLVATVSWPAWVLVAGTVVALLGLAALPVLMGRGHGRRQSDTSARIGDTLLGLVWMLFVWTVLGQLVRLVLMAAGTDGPAVGRFVAVAVVIVVAALAGYGFVEALRLPRTREVDVVLPRLGAGLDGLRVVVVTDTHFGPIDRSGWSRRVVARVNELAPDIVCHAGDLADGAVARRRAQVDPLADVHEGLGRFYITGNHEYFGEAQGWIDHMRTLGWQPLHNTAQVVSRRGDRLVVAGVDDPTGATSGLPGHGPDLASALAGQDPALPVLLLAHQPTQVVQSVEAGVDLQVSGHTHGGQIWPFRYLVRLDQPVVSGLSRHGDRTQLYTSRGTGFWGPPLRVFAPSEITVLTLHHPASR